MSHGMPHFILGSSSPQRRELLAQIRIIPDAIMSPDIDETPFPKEHPRHYVTRMAQKKLQALLPQHKESVILTGDSIVVCGRRIIQKSETAEKARAVLHLLSGRRCQVMSALALYNPQKPDHFSTRLSISYIAVKCLSPQEIDFFIESGEWRGVVGLRVTGIAGSFIRSLRGSYSGIVGLPLFEAKNLLESAGVRPVL